MVKLDEDTIPSSEDTAVKKDGDKDGSVHDPYFAPIVDLPEVEVNQ